MNSFKINYKRKKIKTPNFLNINKQLLSLILTIFIIFNILANIGYCLLNKSHNCNHEKCKICINIENNIECINKYGSIIDFSNKDIHFNVKDTLYIFSDHINHISHKTLISLKVRLDI